jgi:DNA repair protein RecN (Recombination protein N)
VNGSACNLSVLKDLGTHLVDLHGPHDHQSLFSRPEQTLLLDRFSDALPEREAYLARRAELAKVRRELEELLSTSGGEEREARLREEVQEIQSANLSEGEEETIQSRYRAASDSRRLIELAAAGVARLEDEEHGVQTGIAETARLLKDLGRLDERAQPYLDRLEKISSDLDSLISDLRDHAEAMRRKAFANLLGEPSPASLPVAQERCSVCAAYSVSGRWSWCSARGPVACATAFGRAHTRASHCGQ